MLSAMVLGTGRVGQPDVVVVSSPTFFAILSGWWIARRRRARLVVEVRDLWPAIFVELGVLTNRWIIRVLEILEMAAYRVADRVVLVSEGFKASLTDRGIPASKLAVIRNGVDLDRFSDDQPSEPAVRTKLGAHDEDDVLVLYVGAHGISHGLTSVADAASALEEDRRIRFAFVGEGAAKAELEERVRELGLDNVVLHPGVSRDEVPGILAAADICLAPLRDVPLFSTFIPSKIFEYLGSGKAVVGALRGEPARILDEAGAVVVQPEDSTALAEAIEQLADDADRRATMGKQGRAYVEANFDRRELAAQYARILEEVVSA